MNWQVAIALWLDVGSCNRCCRSVATINNSHPALVLDVLAPKVFV